jgi:transposase-like protein
LLKRIDEHLGKGITVELACREIAISPATYYKWRQRYDGMSVADAKELKELRVENSKLKRLVGTAEGLVSSSFLLLSGHFRPLL